jgi:hypothetical protein
MVLPPPKLKYPLVEMEVDQMNPGMRQAIRFLGLFLHQKLLEALRLRGVSMGGMIPGMNSKAMIVLF